MTPLLAVHGRLVAAGARVDPMADALVRQMAYQLAAIDARVCL